MNLTDRIKAMSGADSWGANAPSDEESGPKFGRLRQADVAWVCEQLAVTQEAGLPLYRALGLLATMKSGTGRRGDNLAARLRYMQEMLGEGMSISAVFALNEREWGSVVVALVAAGEASGSLGPAFTRASELIETRLRLRRKLRTAMMYPTVVLVVTAVLVATLLLVVVPRFQEIYASLDADLPEVTLAVMAVADRVPLVILILAVIGASIYMVLRRARTDRPLKLRIDRFKLRIPVIGNLIDKGIQARIASTMGILLSAGVPLLEVLRFASATSGSAPIEDALEVVRQEVADGSTFAASLERTGEFPELMVQLVGVGEESGSLPEMMEKYAKRTNEEVEQATSSLVTIVEPLMMIMVGMVVGVFLLALYLPIISLSSQIK